MEFSKLLEERRSIRKYKPDMVPKEIIEKSNCRSDQRNYKRGDSGSILEEFADDTVLCRCYAGKNRGFFRCMPAGV